MDERKRLAEKEKLGMQLKLGFSPCPNDTFIFDVLVNKKIYTGNFEFVPYLEDVQTLNEWALEGRLDITKLSFPALFASQPQYHLLPAGAALGRGVGPLLVSRQPQAPDAAAIAPLRVALPGAHTTANLLFQFAYPGHVHQEHLLFSDIEDAVLDGRFDLGEGVDDAAGHVLHIGYFLRNIVRRLRHLCRQVFDLAGDDGEPFAGFASAGGFDRGVEGEQVDLVRDVLNDRDDTGHLLCGVCEILGRFVCVFRQADGFGYGGAGMRHGRRNFLDGAVQLFRRRRNALHGGRGLRR